MFSISTISGVIVEDIAEAIVISAYVTSIVNISSDDNTYLSRYIISTNSWWIYKSSTSNLIILYDQQQIYLHLVQDTSNIYQNI